MKKGPLQEQYTLLTCVLSPVSLMTAYEGSDTSVIAYKLKSFKLLGSAGLLFISL